MNLFNDFFRCCFRDREGYQSLNGSDAAVSGATGNNPYNEPAPLAACRTGNLAWLDAEIEKDPSIVFRDYRSGRSGEMVQLLYIAAQEGHLEVVARLIRSGADVNAPMNDGCTALFAAINGHLEMVDQLIDAGAEVDLVNNRGCSALSFAATNGHLEVVERLIACGANVDHAAGQGGTPLMFAAQNGHLAVVECLIDEGANVNLTSNDGTSPLYLAAQNGYGFIVQRLLEAGADPQKKLKIWGFITKSPLSAARRHGGDNAIADMLKKAIARRGVTSANSTRRPICRQNSFYDGL